MSGGKRLASQTDIRERHRQRILQLILSGGGRLSRADLARESGLTAATVSSIVADLIAEEFVLDGETSRSTGGKPATPLVVDTATHRVGAVIAEPHRVRFALLDLNGEVRHEGSIASAGAISTAADIRSAVQQLAAFGREPIVVTGVQVPGVVDDGWVRESVQLGMANEPLFTDSAEYPFPIHLVNDANARLIAERAVRPSDDELSMIYVSQGTGLGLALMVDGRLLSGTNNRAGEIAHVPVVIGADATPCSCGNRGCLETVGAIPAMLGLPFNFDLDSIDLAAHLRKVDTQRTLARAAEHLVRGLTLVAAAVDAPHIVLGDWAPRLGPGYLSLIRSLVDRERMVGRSPLFIEFARADRRSAFWGAAQFALECTLGVRWTASA